MISKRLRGSLDSSICIRDIFEEGKKMAAIYGSENIFNFTIGNPSVEPPAAVNEAMKEILDTEKPLALHGYPANVGHPEVRRHIANYLNGKYDCHYTEQGIIMTSGAAAAIVVIANSLLDNGDEVVTFAPYFWEYKSMWRRCMVNSCRHYVIWRHCSRTRKLLKLHCHQKPGLY